MNTPVKKRKISWPFVFIAPFFIIYIAFNLFPVLFSFYISLTKWNGYGAMEFIGFQNYATLLTDPSFWRSVYNSIMIVFMATIPNQLLGLGLAILLNYGFVRFGSGYVRNAMFLPYLTAPVAIGLIFAVVFDQNFGVVNEVLRNLGLIKENIDWLNTAALAKPLVSGVILWRYVGYVGIIYLAGLQGISTEIYDAARVDGARPFTAMTRIILPMLKPIIVFQVTIGIIGCLKTFEEPLMLFGGGRAIGYNGGMDFAAQTMNMKYLQVAFQSGQSGYGAAVGYAMFVVILVLSTVYFRTIGRDEG